MSLGEKLLEIKANAAQYVGPESQAITDHTIAWLNSSAAVAKALKAVSERPHSR